MEKYLWFTLCFSSSAFALHYCYLFITQRQRGRILKQNLNVKKVTLSPGGIPMVWISEGEFFIDIEVDRNISWKELIDKSKIDLDPSEIKILKLMPKLDIPEKKIERLYFRIATKYNFNFGKLMDQNKDLKPDPFALLTLFTKEKEFFKGYCSFTFWERKDFKYDPCFFYVTDSSIRGIFYEKKSLKGLPIHNGWITGRKK